MNCKNIIPKCITAFLDIIFPAKCAGCSDIISGGEIFCENCRTSLEFIDGSKRCYKCGLQKQNCMCNRYVYHFEGAVCVFEYTGIARSAVHRYKFSRKRQYAEFFAKQMAIAIENEFKDIKFDWVCSVPTSIKSRNKRGFDHCRELCKLVSEYTGIPILENVLFCRRFRPAQHKSAREERLKNVKGKYFTKNKIGGGNILLVDDIKTTGATLDECARQLLFAGADTVYCVTALASVLKKDKASKTKKRMVEKQTVMNYNGCS